MRRSTHGRGLRDVDLGTAVVHGNGRSRRGARRGGKSGFGRALLLRKRRGFGWGRAGRTLDILRGRRRGVARGRARGGGLGRFEGGRGRGRLAFGGCCGTHRTRRRADLLESGGGYPGRRVSRFARQLFFFGGGGRGIDRGRARSRRGRRVQGRRAKGRRAQGRGRGRRRGRSHTREEWRARRRIESLVIRNRRIRRRSEAARYDAGRRFAHEERGGVRGRGGGERRGGDAVEAERSGYFLFLSFYECNRHRAFGFNKRAYGHLIIR